MRNEPCEKCNGYVCICNNRSTHEMPETKTPDEKVLDYLERATKILVKFAPKIRTEWGLEVERTSSVIEIAKLLQREEKI